MSIQELFKLNNGIPEWFNVMLWSLFLLALFFIRYWWKHWGELWFRQKADKIINEEKKKQQENEKLLYAIRDNEIEQDHFSLQQILDKCARKGYCNSQDIESISKIYHHYKKIGGNTDGERIMAKFDLIPYRTELKVPEHNGISNPSPEAMKMMIEFYNNIKSGIIHEQDIRPIKTKTEYVKKEDN